MQQWHVVSAGYDGRWLSNSNQRHVITMISLIAQYCALLSKHMLRALLLDDAHVLPDA